MQPNNNDPMRSGAGQAGAPGNGIPPQGSGVPDWQQGLGTNAVPGQSINPTSPPTPGTPMNGAAPRAPTVPDWQQGLGTATPQVPGTPVAPQPGYGTMPDAGMAAPAPKRGFPKMIIAVAAVVVVLALAAVGYFVFAKNGKPQSADNAAQTSANNAKKSATALSALTSATLAAPADMSGFESDAGTGATHSFSTTGTTSTNGGCELAFGTNTATELPGATINDMVAPGIKALKDNGVTVDGPRAETALVLKDAAGKEYSLPTISYTFKQGAKNAKVVYSIAVTKDGNRTFVRRDCAVNGAVDSSKMDMLAQKAGQITVTATP